MIKLLAKLYRESTVYKKRQEIKILNNLKSWSDEDEELYSFYSSIISPESLLFDVGANIGKRTKIFSRICSQVIAVEPQQYCFGILSKLFDSSSNVVIVNKGLDIEIGTKQQFISDAHTLSSFSEKWITKVKESGRFSDFQWKDAQTVKMTTLDNLIQEFGVPDFIKIDVEGFEFQVIQGLSKKVHLISLEFAKESIPDIISCIEYLEDIDPIELNLCLGENREFHSKKWLASKEIISYFNNVEKASLVSGDVYIRYT